MKYALITTFDVEQPYSFREVLSEKIQGDFNGVIWVELPDDSEIIPKTHKYTDNGFEKLPEPPPRVTPTPVDLTDSTNSDQPIVL